MHQLTVKRQLPTAFLRMHQAQCTPRVHGGGSVNVRDIRGIAHNLHRRRNAGQFELPIEQGHRAQQVHIENTPNQEQQHDQGQDGSKQPFLNFHDAYADSGLKIG